MSEQLVFDSRYSWSRLAVTLAIATIGNVGMWSVIVQRDNQAENAASIRMRMWVWGCVERA